MTGRQLSLVQSVPLSARLETRTKESMEPADLPVFNLECVVKASNST